MWTTPAEILDYYDKGGEHRRVLDGDGRLESVRTRDVLARHLPPASARILDVGGATGVYAEWLTGLGHTVHVVDPVPSHVAAAGTLPGVTAEVGDARELPAPDGSYDAVVMLGPLYHLTERADRVRAYAEAGRAVRPGGLVAAAVISRYASAVDLLWRDATGDEQLRAIVDADLATGQHRNPDRRKGWFTTAYFHHPDEPATEISDAGLSFVGTIAIEGVGWLLPDLSARLDDPARSAELLDMLRAMETEPSMLGVSAHLLALARRPD